MCRELFCRRLFLTEKNSYRKIRLTETALSGYRREVSEHVRVPAREHSFVRSIRGRILSNLP
jgi:hypothetical protein